MELFDGFEGTGVGYFVLLDLYVFTEVCFDFVGVILESYYYDGVGDRFDVIGGHCGSDIGVLG